MDGAGKLIVAILVGLGVGFLVLNQLPDTPEEFLTGISPTPKPQVEFPTVTFEDKTYTYVVSDTVAGTKLALIPNHEDQKMSGELMMDNNCRTGVNGGFYGEDGKPLGWMVSEGREIRKEISSRLFNGFLWVSEGGKTEITVEKPQQPVEHALQTGPVLALDGKPAQLAMAKDKPARRMVALITAAKQLKFASIYYTDNPLLGPELGNMPAILQKMDIGGTIEAAINLDGGTASAFHSPQVDLDELVTVGSWWCVKGE